MENYYTIRRLLMILDLSASPHDYFIFNYITYHMELLNVM